MNSKTGRLTKLALLLAIELVIALVPVLAFPPVSGITMTTLHIPVLIAAVALGPVEGGILGAVFGIMSLISATFPSDPVSAASGYLFSPFVNGGNFWSLVICFVPRILLGVAGGYLFRLLRKTGVKPVISSICATVGGCLLHSFLVLFGIYLFFNAFPLKDVFLAIVSVNCLIETATAVVIVASLTRPLMSQKE